MSPSYEIVFKINPMGAPRTTRADAWKKRPVILKYHAFRDFIVENSKDTPLNLIDTLVVDFYIPMPKSWSKQKRLAMEGGPHQQKPDIDNLVKALLDSIFRDSDDCRVYAVRATKFWANEGRIVVTI